MTINNYIMNAKKMKDFNSVTLFTTVRDYSLKYNLSINDTIVHLLNQYKDKNKIKLLMLLQKDYPPTTANSTLNTAKTKVQPENPDYTFSKIQEQKPIFKHRPEIIKNKGRHTKNRLIARMLNML